MAETDNTQQSDFEKVEAFLRDQVKENVDKYMEQYQQQFTQQQPPAQTETQEERVKKELKQVIDPFIQPQLQEVQVLARATEDYVQFYNDNPLAKEYGPQVEKLFNELRQQGRPISRQALLNHIIGEEYRKDPVTFTAKQQERQKQQLREAETMQDVGAGALARAKSDSKWAEFDKLSVKEMEEALDGVTF